MLRTVLAFSTASAIACAAAFAPIPARAMTVGSAAGIQAAIADGRNLERAAYVCRHRYYSSRRVCWWRPNYPLWRPYRPWRHRHWRSRRW